MTGPVITPIVSVVIPLYNARDVISETIESVFKQTFTDYEITIVDDGSTDGSEEVVQTFGESVRYLRQENGGVAKSRNRGIAESKGRYIALLDHDDLWHPTKLEKQIAVLEARPEVGMVITDVAHIDGDGKPMGIFGPGYNPSEDFARLFVRGYVPTPSAALIRRSVLDAVGGFDETFNSAGLDDHEFWARVASYCEIANIPEPLTYHRNRASKPAQIALRHRPVLLSKLMDQFGQDPGKRRFLIAEQASYFADLGKHLIKNGESREARAHLLRGLALSLREACSWKIVWRCLSRIVRSYL